VALPRSPKATSPPFRAAAPAPAAQGETSGVNTGADNPISLTRGNKYVVGVDLPAVPGELGCRAEHAHDAHCHAQHTAGRANQCDLV
jgi:hypothetical protein